MCVCLILPLLYTAGEEEEDKERDQDPGKFEGRAQHYCPAGRRQGPMGVWENTVGRGLNVENRGREGRE